MAYEMTRVARGLIVTYRGEISDLEVAEFAQRCEADACFVDLRYVLHDFSACTGLTYSADRLNELSAIDAAAARSNSEIHIIIVASQPDVLAAVDIYRNAGFAGFDLSVFASLAEAKRFVAQRGYAALA